MANKAVRDVYERYDSLINKDEHLPENVWVGTWNNLIGSLDGLYNWGRQGSLWPMGFGLACCAIEMICTGFARFDIARFGAELFRATPRQADIMIVSGTVTKKMLPQIVRLYNQMPEPKYVISMGACATGGGPFKEGYNVVSGIDKHLPVDVYIPGCQSDPFRASARVDDAPGENRRAKTFRIAVVSTWYVGSLPCAPFGTRPGRPTPDSDY